MRVKWARPGVAVPPRLRRGHDESRPAKTKSENAGLTVAAATPRRKRIRWTFGAFAFIRSQTGPSLQIPQGEWIMRMKRFGVLATTAVLLALALSVAARAGDQHSGTWKMNPAKSMYNPGPAAKSVTMRIESDENGFKINAEGIGGDGNQNSTARITPLAGCQAPIRYR
jgi:hypothetical protein